MLHELEKLRAPFALDWVALFFTAAGVAAWVSLLANTTTIIDHIQKFRGWFARRHPSAESKVAIAKPQEDFGSRPPQVSARHPPDGELAVSLMIARNGYERNYRLRTYFEELISEYGLDSIERMADTGCLDAAVVLFYSQAYMDDKTSAAKRGRYTSYILKAAAAGDASAMCIKARLHDGSVLPKNDAEALRLHKEAAHKGSPEAIYRFALIYYFGNLGVAKDDHEAIRLMKLAIEHGSSYAKFFLGNIYSQYSNMQDEAIRLWREAANENVINAKIKLLEDEISNPFLPGRLNVDFGPSRGMSMSATGLSTIRDLLNDPELDDFNRERLSKWL